LAPQKQYVIRGGVEGRERLRILSRINRPSTLDLLQRAGIRPGMVCLDIGCGGGDVAFELARLVEPGGRIVALDFDEVKLEIARAEANAQQIHNIEFGVANLDECELPSGFDLVHARFVLQHLQDPARTLVEMRKALKPGGVVVVADTDFRGLFSEPESPTIRRLVELYSQTLKRRGGNPNLGVLLPALLARSGFENVKISVAQNVATEGETKLIIPMTLENSAEAVVAEGVASREEIDAIVSESYEFARDPTTVLSGPRIIQTLAFRPIE
jgi:SAM-dependent methyltransferase